MWIKSKTLYFKIVFLLILPFLFQNVVSTTQAAEKKAWWETITQSSKKGDGSSAIKIPTKTSPTQKPVYIYPIGVTIPSVPGIDRALLPSKIAFTSDRDGNSEIYVMNADGTGQRNITNTPTHEAGPALSPDGTKIAFWDIDREPGIYVMNVDGTDQRRLTNQLDGFPAWSHDGGKIAFSRVARGDLGEIYVMNADRSEQTRLTNNLSLDQEPSWSVDGRIAFKSYRDGNFEIYVMSADGAGQTNLTNTPSGEGGWLGHRMEPRLLFRVIEMELVIRKYMS